MEKSDGLGYALDKESDSVAARGSTTRRKRKSSSFNAPTSQTNQPITPAVSRTFPKASNKSNDAMKMTLATPSYIQSKKNQEQTPYESNVQTPWNPYDKSRTVPPSSAKHHSNHLNSSWSSTHVICAISENLARETCITYMDAGSPIALNVVKLANGNMYAETIAFLESLYLTGEKGSIGLDEILLNEGRKNSQLCKKIQEAFSQEEDNFNDNRSRSDTRTLTGSCTAITVVKFVPRSYFDQNRGAELLRSIVRKGCFDQGITEEYILLSSSYALLQYLQICLGANFARNSIEIVMNSTGKNRLAMDRGTILHLELLANNKTGKVQNSLIGTIDCTKTSIGSRLLRSNLMAPPTRLDTITARLDLCDCFLEDETFFYEIMDLLSSLPDIEKMLAHMALVPREVGKSKGSLFGGKRQITARMASKGISALVCIKSALSLIPNFVHVLEMQLKYFKRQDKRRQQKDQMKSMDPNAIDGGSDEKSKGEERSSEGVSEDSSSSSESSITDDDVSLDDEEEQTTSSSILLGLGSGPYTSKFFKNRYNLLQAILKTMKNPALKEVLDAVLDIFTESTTYTKNSHAMRHQECFALKPNTDGMMDVLRKAFLANVDDIYKLADQYAETFGFTVSVKETTSRGYYLSIPLKSMNSDLPPTFIQSVKTGKFINCTTEEVLSLSSRAQENVQDLLLMTHDRIQEVINIAREKYDALASLSDAIALLDMCHTFADNVTRSRLPWCRPIISDCSRSEDISKMNNIVGSGSIAIRNGRFGIDVSKTGLSSTDNNDFRGYIPNDTYASAFQNFTVITGVNGSGKSTYLKQIAISVILAHCGSYVPAEEAFIPIRDRICTRIGTCDDQEHNISTFLQEMKDTAYICKNATDKSLILIDELGRATSNEDGVAIAWAIAEFLLVKRAMTFFVTHYPQLCRLADVYPNVQNQHLEATVDEHGIRYSHKILPGSCQMSADYGVEMAATCGWQREVIEYARSIHSEIECKLPDNVLCQKNHEGTNLDMLMIRHQAEAVLNDLAKHLVALKASEDRLNDNARKSYLQDLREQYVTPSDPNITKMMLNLLLDKEETCAPSLPLQPEGLVSIIAHCYENLRVKTTENDMPINENSNSEGDQTLILDVGDKNENSSIDQFDLPIEPCHFYPTPNTTVPSSILQDKIPTNNQAFSLDTDPYMKLPTNQNINGDSAQHENIHVGSDPEFPAAHDYSRPEYDAPSVPSSASTSSSSSSSSSSTSSSSDTSVSSSSMSSSDTSESSSSGSIIGDDSNVDL